MSSGALERCIGDTTAFLDACWGRRSLHVRTGDPYSELIAPGDFDAILSRSLLPTAAFRLVKDGKPLPEKSYTRPFGGRRTERLQVADPTLVWDEFHDGATIVLEGLHKYWGPLTEFCRDLEQQIGHPTQVNAYITPPGSQGFARHVDVHDVFVLQIHGEKLWEVAERAGEDELGPVLLSAGDSLYIPTGCAHSARTSDKPSIHLTVGVLVQTWGDLIGDLLELARGDLEFAERLPVERERDSESVNALSKEATRRLQEWLEEVDPDVVRARIARRLLTTRHERNEGMLEQLLVLPDLTDDSEIARIASGRVSESRGRLLLLLPDRELELPITMKPALGYVLDRRSFLVGELAEFLDESGRIGFVARLIREGLLSATHRVS